MDPHPLEGSRFSCPHALMPQQSADPSLARGSWAMLGCLPGHWPPPQGCQGWGTRSTWPLPVGEALPHPGSVSSGGQPGTSEGACSSESLRC